MLQYVSGRIIQTELPTPGSSGLWLMHLLFAWCVRGEVNKGFACKVFEAARCLRCAMPGLCWLWIFWILKLLKSGRIWIHGFLNVLASPKCLLTGVRVAPLPYVMHATLYAHDIYIYIYVPGRYVYRYIQMWSRFQSCGNLSLTEGDSVPAISFHPLLQIVFFIFSICLVFVSYFVLTSSGSVEAVHRWLQPEVSLQGIQIRFHKWELWQLNKGKGHLKKWLKLKT